MAKKILVFDTSILCVWLQIPGKMSCGPKDNVWDYQRVDKLITQEEKNGSTFVLPLAAIIETGNHISQCSGDRYELANKFATIIRKTADEKTPWAAFTQQAEMWDKVRLNRLADEWPKLAVQRVSIGDATIKDVADYYAKSGIQTVEIITGDEQLRNYQPSKPKEIGVMTPPRPRRRQ
ncbi:MAG: hypothetical protein H7832_05945 [Magnetococcus sp. DMHC-6]